MYKLYSRRRAGRVYPHEIDIQETHTKHRRVRWVSGSPGKPPAYAGADFIIARDAKITAVYLFFDELP